MIVSVAQQLQPTQNRWSNPKNTYKWPLGHHFTNFSKSGSLNYIFIVIRRFDYPGDVLNKVNLAHGETFMHISSLYFTNAFQFLTNKSMITNFDHCENIVKRKRIEFYTQHSSLSPIRKLFIYKFTCSSSKWRSKRQLSPGS